MENTDEVNNKISYPHQQELKGVVQWIHIHLCRYKSTILKPLCSHKLFSFEFISNRNNTENCFQQIQCKAKCKVVPVLY